MKKSIYFIILTILLSGCANKHIYKNSSIFGNWYTYSTKNINSTIKANLTIKEQFLNNNILLNTKWYNFKDIYGNDLGEFYITKLFKYEIKNNIIKAKFIRCSTAITKPLKYKNLGYLQLSKMCKLNPYSNKITLKEYKIINNTLILGNQRYKKER